MPIQVTAFNVTELLREVTTELEPIIAKSGLKVETKVASDMPAIRSDRQKVKQIVVNLQGDEPLMTPALIGQVAALLAKKKDAVVSTACHAIHDALDNPNVVKVVLDHEGYALYFSRSQIPFPREPGGVCYRHAGIYGYRVGFLKKFSSLEQSPLERAEALEQLRVLWHGFRIAVAVSETEIPPGVDTPQDLEAVRKMFS